MTVLHERGTAMQVTDNSHHAPQAKSPPAKDHAPPKSEPPHKTHHAKAHTHHHVGKHVDKSA